LINCHLDTATKNPYRSLGAIYNDAIKYIPEDTNVITFWDDDDLFYDDHLAEGVNGLVRGGKTAYKPATSYFRQEGGMYREKNLFEPSVFINASHILKYGFNDTTTDHHFKWLDPLIFNDEIYIDPYGRSTLIYNWIDEVPVYKTSGKNSNPNTFDEFRTYSFDHGDRIISPVMVFGEVV
jgi:hypothetical protein